MQECLNCGQAVTLQFCRVFGTDDDDVHACHNCTSIRRLSSGAAAQTNE